ncbi:GLPGLI family protein [Subsaximicrobium wynnwilliamsii]|uniref:GLPGLI family protein n=1 Tax=Subsaximicrobium wynnwilliamsii TaxID=291179 RepID=A0A5C6ZKU8_9FLAO|nr:GLPGLI family protein [Subsaximicrobium wynnwilliamsii]TXD83897.1 GLPGLI family protein [Subsaximicrobium wynnwilliamsii]TXD89637.1 GLPGLI family protein [Subsaximicrobium wynnwilliamsii]TXE02571.1 GLPGLI family protein [Subsaximicrobium wynnwilliamsii]
MIRNSIFILILLHFSNSYSQQIEGKIIYKSKIEKVTDKENSALNALNRVIENNDYADFELSFKNNETLFKIAPNLEQGDNELNLSKILLGARYIFYSNNQKHEMFYQLEAYGAFFLISYESIKWELTKDSKKIGDYNCYKATTTKKVRNSRGVFEHKVTAWYTPEIPISIGPKGYHGLPGLVLELREKNKVYVAKNINLNNLEENITIPTKGRKISQYDFDNIGIEMDEARQRD